MDIIVTTPKTESDNAKLEAQHILSEGGGMYFRRFERLPTKLQIGDRVFYTENGYVRGFAIVNDIVDKYAEGVCTTTNRVYPKGYYVFMDASTWKWITPIPYKGFQGFRYYEPNYTIIGDWEDPMPTINHG